VALDLSHCDFLGPALPVPFVKFDLEPELKKAGLLPKTTGAEGKALRKAWDSYRRGIRSLVSKAGAVRVRHTVIEPLIPFLGFRELKNTGPVRTREGDEDGGYLLVNGNGSPHLRVWAKELDVDLDAPARRGAAYRYSYLRIAQRVLLASGERVGLLTNGSELRIIISDPARPDSQVIIKIDTEWKRARDVPDSFLLLLSLCSPAGIRAVPELVDRARLKQTTVTKELRVQARRAVERFIQEILDHPENRDRLSAFPDKSKLARELWREGLVIIYRLLFILKGESNDDPARNFSFASTSLWRNTYSPSVALAYYARNVLDRGAETGSFLESGVRAIFRMFAEGLQCTELNVQPLGGALFGADATPLLSSLKWGEHAVAHLLDQLLWTAKQRGSDTRERVHYGPLDVEDLGRVYEALLELEPGITSETMCRLRRAKLEVAVPVAQSEKYRKNKVTEPDYDADDAEEDNAEDDEDTGSRKKTKVEFVEEIPRGKFYLRVGLGRKTTGSYYTPHSFVRFLVQETCGPLVEEKSPKDDPNPLEILKLKVLDPAMGSGHFLVEACRFLGEKLYEACRLCDELATAAEKALSAAEKQLAELHEKEKNAKLTFEERKTLRDEIAEADKKRKQAKDDYEKYWQRVIDLPDPNDEILSYLPSRAPEGEERGLSEKKALALCRRLISVHCLYGVDKNPLAVELAKLSLWLESHAEGLPLTFLDHRLVVGDSLTGPFWEHLLRYPGSRKQLEDLFSQDIYVKFTKTLSKAVMYVDQLQATVGSTLAEIENKKRLKGDMDRALAPFKVLAAAWSGGVMLGPDVCDDPAYAALVKHVGETGDLPEAIAKTGETEPPAILRMISLGLGMNTVPAGRDDIYALMRNGTPGSLACIPALPYDLAFPEVFFPYCQITAKAAHGFHVVLGNPPWDAIRPKAKEFYAVYDFNILAAPTKRERTSIEKRLKQDSGIEKAHQEYEMEFAQLHLIHDTFFEHQVVEVNGKKTGGDPEASKLFLERFYQITKRDGYVGIVVPSGFHANEGATGIRRLYLQKMALKHCYSFENRKKLFEIHSSFKFACVVAKKDSNGTDEFNCAFYLHDDEFLFTENEFLVYSIELIKKISGEQLSFPEIRTKKGLEIAYKCFSSKFTFKQISIQKNMRFGRELHLTDDAWRFTPKERFIEGNLDTRKYDVLKDLIRKGAVNFYEGKSFNQYDDCWGEPPRYVIEISNIKEKKRWLKNIKYFRAVHRKISSSTNERTAIFCCLTPGNITGASCTPEQYSSPFRPTCYSLVIISVGNSFTFDWTSRQLVTSNFQDNIRDILPFPDVPEVFCAHCGLRLVCTHNGFAPLWREQLGDAWREPGKAPFTWPVLGTEEERWEVRSAIDAVVADAYGLNREQYEHVLDSFDMPSRGPNPYTGICLAKFDELKKIGLDAFTKKYDPYWDIPLNESLPKPVIDIPGIPDLDSDSPAAADGNREFKLTNPRRKRQVSLDFSKDERGGK